jgi:hypothetical protein
MRILIEEVEALMAIKRTLTDMTGHAEDVRSSGKADMMQPGRYFRF